MNLHFTLQHVSAVPRNSVTTKPAALQTGPQGCSCPTNPAQKGRATALRLAVVSHEGGSSQCRFR